MIKLLVALVALQITCSRSFTIQPKILNGSKSTAQNFPYFVLIVGEQHACGGTLISGRWILTAGHCLMLETPVAVYLGANDDGAFFDSIEIPLARQYIHHESNPLKGLRDIGLIELPGELQPSPYYRPVQLPTDCGEQLENVTVAAVGMGRTSLNQREPNSILYEGVFKTLAADECLELITVLGSPTDSDAVLCARPDGEMAVYDGDSGGPLVLQEDNTLLGVAAYVHTDPEFDAVMQSLGTFHKNPVVLQVFTKIHYYFDWISAITGLDLPNCSQS